MSKVIACLSSIAVTLVVATTATAQTETEQVSAGLELEEIVVTAEKRDTNLQKTAQSIQVFSGEQLQKEGKSRVDEILNGVAGVNLQSNQVGSEVYIRGNSQGVAVVVDGAVSMRSETMRGGTLDVSQVEVMRGTQAATTVGGNVLAGAVSLVSNQPVFEYQATGSLEVGSYNLRNTQGVLNLPFGNNQALRASFSTNKRDGYISANAGNSEQFQGRLKYRWQPTEDLDIVATVNNQNIGGNGVSASTLLYTGHWNSWSSITGNSNNFSLNGANYTAYGSTTTGSGISVFRNAVDGRGVVGTGGTLSPACYTGGVGSLVSTSNAATPFIYVMGCPAMYVAVRDGVTYDQRSNPWNDGYPADIWPNNPYRHTDIKTYQVDLNWNTAIGKLTAIPSIQRATFQSQEVQRGTSYMAENRTQGYEQLDVRLASNNDSFIEWLGGLNYNHTGASKGLFKTVYLPITAYPTVANNSNTTNLTSCYLTDAPFNCYATNRTLGGGTTDLAAYANGSIKLLEDDKLRFSAGVRSSHSKVSYYGTNELLSDADGNRPYVVTVSNTAGAYSSAKVATPFTIIRGDTYYNHTVWNAGVQYDVLPEAMLYANYATGYQRGGLSTSGMGVTATTLVAGPGLTLEQMTVGLKSRWFDNRVQANIEGFDSKYHNRTFNNVGLGTTISNTDTPTGATAATCSANSSTPLVASFLTTGSLVAGCFALNTATYYADMRSRGIDLDLAFLPTSNDRIDLSLEYLRSNFTKAIGVSNYTGADVLALASQSGTTDAAVIASANTLAGQFNSYMAAVKGATLTNSPRWSGNVSYQHEFKFANAGTLTPRATMSYKSEYWMNASAAQGNPITEAALAMSTGRFYPAVQRSYTMFDFYTTYAADSGKFQLSAYVKNLQNRAVMTSASPTYGTGQTVSANNIVVTGGYVDLMAPRTVGVTLSANF